MIPVNLKHDISHAAPTSGNFHLYIKDGEGNFRSEHFMQWKFPYNECDDSHAMFHTAYLLRYI